jgi:hypothetical protein
MRGHASVESISDVDVGAVEVWVGHADHVAAAQLGDRLSRRSSSSAIQSQITLPWPTHEQCPLANPQCRFDVDADQVRFLAARLAGVIADEVRDGGPSLAVPADLLALVLAGPAVRWRLLGVGVLHGAGGADAGRHP